MTGIFNRNFFENSLARRRAAATAAMQHMMANHAAVKGAMARPSASRPKLPDPPWLRFVPVDIRGIIEAHIPPATWDCSGKHRQVMPRAVVDPAPASSQQTERVLPSARFLLATFTNHAGTRPYKVYVPSTYQGDPTPLVVMLHGCKQSPDDLAAGTGMNAEAEKRGWLVAYPEQVAAANAQKCWKWFSEADQQRDYGEPSLIAGITRQVMQDFVVDSRRIYVAGFSAGGAAAAVMGETYPDLYAAVGVHSGLARGAAQDLASALTAMKRGMGNDMSALGSSVPGRIVPTIIFHGDSDTIVNSCNGDEVAARATRGHDLHAKTYSTQVAGGHSYRCIVHSDHAGKPFVEQWAIHGGGHAWFGGRSVGSYTDPRGPDATVEFLRFFFEHHLPKLVYAPT